MKGEGKKLRPIKYGPFSILEKSGNNDYCIDLTTYMQMYSMVNVENLKLYEPAMIMDLEESGQVPSVDDSAPEYLDKLPRDIILDRRTKTSQWGEMEDLRVALNGMNHSKARWIETEKVRDKFHHLPVD